jgi:hypothetical protein
VAGVLGKNPPPPLQPGLAQSIEWDGRADWGRLAGAGPFRVRVALGLGAKYDRVVVGDPANKRVVVVSEKDGAFAGSFPTISTGIDLDLSVDRVGKAVYVRMGPGPRGTSLPSSSRVHAVTPATVAPASN